MHESAAPLISVVLNTYNRAAVLPNAIESLLSQSFNDFEVVVVDDGSTDGTAEVVGAYDDTRLRYVRRSNGGLAPARNTGIAESCGRYVAFMDDDDAARPGWLAAMAGQINPLRTGAVTCGAEIRGPAGTPTVVRLPSDLGAAFDHQIGLFLPGTFCVRRDVLDSIGGYFEELRCSEQTELSLRVVPYCVEHGLTIEAVMQPMMVTNREADERRPLRRADYLHDGALLVIERHGDRLRRSPRLYADFLAIAAVQGARMGRYREARRLLMGAIRADPFQVKQLARLAVASMPPVARRTWGTWEPPNPTRSSQPATGARVDASAVRSKVPTVVKRISGARSLRQRLAPPPWPPRRVPASPPPTQPGWVIAPPDFVGIGTQRGGTSWWHSLICAHPNVHVNPDMPKEMHYFDRFHDQRWTEPSIAAYHELFPRPEGTLTGEWTPEYMVWPWCPPLLAAAGVPRLIVCLRDPVERYQAGWSFSVRRGAPAVPTIAGDAFHRGFYHRQLEAVLQHFERSQLLVLQYEACLSDPRPHLRRTYEFLGLDPEYAPDAPGARVKAAHHKDPLEDDMRRVLTEAYRPDLLALFEAFPELDPDRWPSAAALVT